MSQQINLFNPVFLKQKRHFSALAMAQALGIIVLGLLALYAYELHQIRVLEQTASDTEKQLVARRAQLVSFSKQFSEEGTSRALAAELSVAESRLKDRRVLLEDVRTGVGGDVRGYTRYLSALSQASTPGVWLVGLEVGGKTAELLIKGRALESELIPAYIAALNRAAPFAGRPIAELQVAARVENAGQTRPAPGPSRYLEFSLAFPRGDGS